MEGLHSAIRPTERHGLPEHERCDGQGEQGYKDSRGSGLGQSLGHRQASGVIGQSHQADRQ